MNSVFTPVFAPCISYLVIISVLNRGTTHTLLFQNTYRNLQMFCNIFEILYILLFNHVPDCSKSFEISNRHFAAFLNASKLFSVKLPVFLVSEKLNFAQKARHFLCFQYSKAVTDGALLASGTGFFFQWFRARLEDQGLNLSL